MRTVGEILDAESVRDAQKVMYGCFVGAAIQALAHGAPPTVISDALGWPMSLVWDFMMLFCPIITLIGYARRHRNPVGGVVLELGGDIGVTFGTAAYVVAAWQATWATRATLAPWMAFGLTICAVGMIGHNVRRLLPLPRRMRRMRELSADE